MVWDQRVGSHMVASKAEVLVSSIANELLCILRRISLILEVWNFLLIRPDSLLLEQFVCIPFA